MNIFEAAAFFGLPSIVAFIFLIGTPDSFRHAVVIGFGSALVALCSVILFSYIYRFIRGRPIQRAHVFIWAAIAVLLSASLALYFRFEQKSPPNHSQQPTPIGRPSSAFAVDIAGAAWLGSGR